MYTTAGIDAIATITELRSNTTELIEHVRKSRGALLIQKNNDPFAVLLDWETYNELLNGRAEPEAGQIEDREPKRRRARSSSVQGQSEEP